MATMTESCTICGTAFEVQFTYQMEERDGGFSFYCSQKCLELSQTGGCNATVPCEACAKRFSVELVSQVFYVDGKRRYACSLDCRAQLRAEANGVRLGDMVHGTIEAERTPQPPAVMVSVPERRTGVAAVVPRPVAAAVASAPRAEAVSLIPQGGRTANAVVPVASAKKRDPEAPRIIAIFNHKGGTGKTTTSVSVAAGLAARGHKVLLVDTDAQGNVSVSLDAKSEKSLYHVLVMGLPVKTACQQVRPNLDLVASNETLAAAELYLAGRQNRDRVLRDRMAPHVGAYDYVVLDCSPSLSLMNQNALVFADSVLVPVACDYLSLVGVRQVLKTVRNVNQLLHHPVRIWGVLPTFYDARAKICREAVETMQQHFGDRCLEPIRSAIRIKEAPAHGQTIFEYAAGSPAAEDYKKVVDRIIGGAAAARRDTMEDSAEAISA